MKCDIWLTSSSRHGELGINMFAMADVRSPQPWSSLLTMAIERARGVPLALLWPAMERQS